jgi:hypothetical protein
LPRQPHFMDGCLQSFAEKRLAGLHAVPRRPSSEGLQGTASLRSFLLFGFVLEIRMPVLNVGQPPSSYPLFLYLRFQSNFGMLMRSSSVPSYCKTMT